MSHEAEKIAWEAAVQDLRRDFVEPHEQFSRELTALRHQDLRLLATIRKSHRLLLERICDMAATITDLQNNVATLKTVQDQLVALVKGGADPAVVDAINTQVVALIDSGKAALPTPPAVATVEA